MFICVQNISFGIIWIIKCFFFTLRISRGLLSFSFQMLFPVQCFSEHFWMPIPNCPSMTEDSFQHWRQRPSIFSISWPIEREAVVAEGATSCIRYNSYALLPEGICCTRKRNYPGCTLTVFYKHTAVIVATVYLTGGILHFHKKHVPMFLFPVQYKTQTYAGCEHVIISAP